RGVGISWVIEDLMTTDRRLVARGRGGKSGRAAVTSLRNGQMANFQGPADGPVRPGPHRDWAEWKCPVENKEARAAARASSFPKVNGFVLSDRWKRIPV